MKKFIFSAVFFILLLTPLFRSYAQSLSASEPTQVTFDTTGLPVWVKDLRRWEIIGFGTFPFTLFAVTFITDMILWGNENGMDFSAEGRRYAPWPFKSAGGIEMSSQDFQRSVLIAAGLSMTLAFIDLFIVISARNKEQRRLENAPSGSFTIEKIPPDEGEDDDPPLQDDRDPGGDAE